MRHAWSVLFHDTKAAPYRWPSYRENSPSWSLGGADEYPRYVADGFEANALIYSAIAYKSRAITAAKLRAYTGDITSPVPLDANEPLAKLLFRPNPYQSQSELLQLAETYLNLSGNAYIHLDRRSASATPNAMRLLRPDRVRIIPGDGGIKGYVYIPEGGAVANGVPILPADLIHAKLPNPGDPLEGLGYGLSPIAPLSRSGDVDNQVTRFLKLFFERGTLSTSLLKFDNPMTDEEIQTVKARWREVYGGADNWTDVAVLDNRGDVRTLGMPFDEMGFTTIDERNEARILAPFGVPGILIGSRSGLARATYANFESARRQFWEDVFVPELQLYETEADYYLVQPDSGVFIRFDMSNVPALRQDVYKQADAASKLWAMGVPATAAFKTVGLQVGDVPGGDIGYLPLSLVPIGSSTPTATEQQPTSDTATATQDTRKALEAPRPFPRRRPVSRATTPVPTA